jgi:hypothetical protein
MVDRLIEVWTWDITKAKQVRCPLDFNVRHNLLLCLTFRATNVGSRWRYSTPPPHGSDSQSKSYCDWRSVSQSVSPVSLGVEPHLGLMTRYLLLFDSYGLVFNEKTGLTLYMLLVLASAVFLGSESLGTRRPYLTVSNLTVPFSYPPTTRRVTMEVSDPELDRSTDIASGWVI